MKKKKIIKIKRKRKRVSAYITADEILELETKKRFNESLARSKKGQEANKAREKKSSKMTKNERQLLKKINFFIKSGESGKIIDTKYRSFLVSGII